MEKIFALIDWAYSNQAAAAISVYVTVCLIFATVMVIAAKPDEKTKPTDEDFD